MVYPCLPRFWDPKVVILDVFSDGSHAVIYISAIGSFFFQQSNWQFEVGSLQVVKSKLVVLMMLAQSSGILHVGPSSFHCWGCCPRDFNVCHWQPNVFFSLGFWRILFDAWNQNPIDEVRAFGLTGCASITRHEGFELHKCQPQCERPTCGVGKCWDSHGDIDF